MALSQCVTGCSTSCCSSVKQTRTPTPLPRSQAAECAVENGSEVERPWEQRRAAVVSKLEYVSLQSAHRAHLWRRGSHECTGQGIFAQASRTGIKYTLVRRTPAQRVKWSLKLNRVPGLYLSDWASICQTGPLFVGLGLYLSDWAFIWTKQHTCQRC